MTTSDSAVSAQGDEDALDNVREFRLLLKRLEEPIRTMCIVAACLGLRASEVAGLQWGDFDWGNRQVHMQRGFVIGHVDEVKTTNSNRSLPVHRGRHPGLIAQFERLAKTRAT